MGKKRHEVKLKTPISAGLVFIAVEKQYKTSTKI